jgi:hypothetical protein
MRHNAPHRTAGAILEQPRNHLVGNSNFQSLAVIAAPVQWTKIRARSFPERIARCPSVASRGRDATTSPFDFPRASASYVRAGGDARCPSTLNGDLHGSYHVECV